MESLHKLTAGDGYDYLTRQVAAADATDLGRSSLGDYYAEKGETPGVWLGSGLAALGAGKHAVAVGDTVTQEQMKALFGEGLHPNADAILAEAIALGRSEQVALSLTRLGRPFKVYSGASAFRVEVARRFQAYNGEVGTKWNAAIDPEVRAAIRTQVSREFFETEYGRGPLHDTELSGWMARLSRQQTDAVAGFDATFSPVKSVSALWALAPRPVADTIAAAHHAAVADALRYLETHACYTRLGTDGIAQVDGDGFLAAAFTHRDSRAGDPDLHTHLVISNKVRTTGPDGLARWLALDARPLYKLTVSASEIYNSRVEAHLTDGLPIRFAPRDTGDHRKRPVREIVGIDPTLLDAWSTRRAAIDTRTGELAREFQRGHGREPTPVETVALAQQANLETRQRKHEPRSLAEQRATWYQEATHVLGGPAAVTAMLADTLTHPTITAPTITPEWISEHADAIVATTSAARARWQTNHLRAEAERVVRAAGIPLADMDTVAARLVDAACDPTRAVKLSAPTEASTVLTPDVLRRRDGSSVYTVAGSQLFTSDAVLAAETRLLWAAQRPGGHVATDRDVELALLEAAANGRELNTGQATLVRELATSGRRLQLALAPAGTGKTTAMKTLARAWTNTPGRRVLGLAPTAAAAAVLREEIDTTTDNLAKLNHLIYTAAGLDPTVMPTPIADRALELGHGLPLAYRLPTWFTRIGAGTLVVVDEAGMTGTRELDLAVSYLLDRGADVRLIADDRQLAAVAAGGILRDIADTAGAVTLSHVVRFTDTAEGPASLALRAGDPAALGFYLDHHRIHVGSAATVTDDGYTAWARDRDAGRDTIMLACTRDTVDQLNARARTDRLATTTPTTAPRKGLGRWLHRRTDADRTREVLLADGLSASGGDIVCTRRNNRTIPITATDWVRNGDRWHVEVVLSDGSMRVRHLDLHRSVTLPADYVREHTTLGYARTIHGAQGLTADTCHTILTGTETRELLYVAATRGRHANHLYLTTAGDGDLHSVMTAKGLLPPTAVDTLTEMLRRDSAEPSAHTTLRELADPATRLHHAADAYDDAVGVAAETLLGSTTMTGLDADADLLVHGITHQPAWPVLRRHLATLALDGADPLEHLADAAARAELGTTRDTAAVLDWRIDHTGLHSHQPGPLPWLPAVPTALVDHQDWAPYLTARTQEVRDYASRLAETAATWTPTSAPVWARPYAGTDAVLTAELAVFRAAHCVDEHDRRPTGPDQYPVASRREQTELTEAASAVAADPATAAARWKPLVDSLDPHIVRDPYWLDLADKLDRLARAGLDVTTLTHTAATEWPLPETLPAAALWWRLACIVEPGALQADQSAVVIRPDWVDALADIVGYPRAHRVMADPAWPTLVAAVESAHHTDWTPHSLIGTAHDLLAAGHGDAPVPPDELAAALAVRVELLVRLETARPYLPVPDEPPLTPEEEESLIPLDTHAAQPAETYCALVHDESDESVGYGCLPAPSEGVPLPDPPQDDELAPPLDDDIGPPDRLCAMPRTDIERVAVARRTAEIAYQELERFARTLDAPAHGETAGVTGQPASTTTQERSGQAPPRQQAIDANQQWIDVERTAEDLIRRIENLTAQRESATPENATIIETELAITTADAQRLLDLVQSAHATAIEADIELRTASSSSTRRTANAIGNDIAADALRHAVRTDQDTLARLGNAVSAAEQALGSTETNAARAQVDQECTNDVTAGTPHPPSEATKPRWRRSQTVLTRPERVVCHEHGTTVS